MRRIVCFLFLVVGAYAYAQDGLPGMEGNYGDIRFTPPQTEQPNDFVFARLIYQGKIPAYIKNWYTDYPSGDANLVKILRRATNLDIAPENRAVLLHDDALFKYPFIYSAEAGQIVFDDADARRMREYLDRGGFWMVDDFWGTYEWDSFADVVKKIFPDQEIVDIPLDHSIFHSVYDMHEVMQVPNVAYAYTYNAVTWEQEGRTPYVRGVFDNNGNMQLLILFNSDVMDASEWADDPKYPHKFSAYAYRLFINAVVYTMTH